MHCVAIRLNHWISEPKWSLPLLYWILCCSNSSKMTTQQVEAFLLLLTLKTAYVQLTQDCLTTQWPTARRRFNVTLSQRIQTLRDLHPSWDTRRKLSLSRWQTCKCSTSTRLQQRNNNPVLLLLPCSTFSCVLLLQMTHLWFSFLNLYLDSSWDSRELRQQLCDLYS